MPSSGGLPESIRRRLDPDERYGLRLTLAAVALLLVAVPFAAITIAILGPGPVAQFDRHVAIDLNEEIYRHHFPVVIFDWITRLGSAPVLATAVLATALFLWRQSRKRTAFFVMITGGGGAVLNAAVKLLVDRSRPVVPYPIATALGKSFPSGHTMSSTVCLGAILVALLPLIGPRWRAPAITTTVLVVVAIGSSRILLGVHFFTDVIAGFILGFAWLSASTAAFEIWRAEERREVTTGATAAADPDRPAG